MEPMTDEVHEARRGDSALCVKAAARRPHLQGITTEGHSWPLPIGLTKDLYTVLGVPDDSTDDALKQAYRRLVRQHHPDTNAGCLKAERRFKEVGAAYAVLSNRVHERDAQYDRTRHQLNTSPASAAHQARSSTRPSTARPENSRTSGAGSRGPGAPGPAAPDAGSAGAAGPGGQCRAPRRMGAAVVGAGGVVDHVVVGHGPGPPRRRRCGGHRSSRRPPAGTQTPRRSAAGPPRPCSRGRAPRRRGHPAGRSGCGRGR